MTPTGMKKHVGVLQQAGARHHAEGRARADLQTGLRVLEEEAACIEH